MSIATIHDWLLRSWFGVLATAVIGAFCYAVISKMLGSFLGWLVTTIPATVRSLSRQSTMLHINELEEIHNNTYVLLRTLIGELGQFAMKLGVAIFLCVPVSLVEGHYFTRHLSYQVDHRVTGLAFSSLILIANVVGTSAIALVQTSLRLWRLSADLMDYESAIERLRLHLRDLDTRDGRVTTDIGD
jgi:hypothetical protein